MVEYKDVEFEGFDCIQLQNAHLSIWITKNVGLRILGLSYQGGENLFVVLPEAVIPVEGSPDYKLRGGHRLWYGPEVPKVTYISDDQEIETRIEGNQVEQFQPIDQPTEIQKSWRITIDPEEAKINITHRLTNQGSSSFELAPWAITMLRTGGIGCIPLNTQLEDEFGLQPNRQLVLWPYSKINSTCLKLTDTATFVNASIKEGALKVGSPNPIGWIAYSNNEMLFVKYADFQKNQFYLDRMASSQIYCNPDLIELETLGPLIELAPGEIVEHLETWQVYPEDRWPSEIEEVFKII